MRVSMYFLHLELTYTSLHGGSCEYRDWYAGWTMPSTEPNSRGSLGTRLAIIRWNLWPRLLELVRHGDICSEDMEKQSKNL